MDCINIDDPMFYDKIEKIINEIQTGLESLPGEISSMRVDMAQVYVDLVTTLPADVCVLITNMATDPPAIQNDQKPQDSQQ